MPTGSRRRRKLAAASITSTGLRPRLSLMGTATSSSGRRAASPPAHWQTTRFCIDLARPRVMGIVNVTPDSFSDGGRHHSAEAACRHADQLVEEGADILDIGGESTRPGAPPVSAQEELARVMPVLRHALNLNVPVSIDTCKTAVMREALSLGVDIVNDVRALADEGAVELLVAHRSAAICLMHM